MGNFLKKNSGIAMLCYRRKYALLANKKHPERDGLEQQNIL
jgi:hypothetical protein